MSTMNVNQVLNQMRIMAAQASGQPAATNNTTGVDFSNAMKSAVNHVNDLQQQSGNLQTSFESGDPNVSLAQVMLAGQKSNVAFQATVQIRNKFVDAYRQVMQMPI